MNDQWIAGKHPVLEALKAAYPINKLWVAKEQGSGALGEILKLARQQKVVVQTVPKKRLDQVTEGMVHQGVLAFVAPYPYAELSDLFQRAEEKGEPPFFLLLDGLEDPHNLGSILRTADAAGVHGVILPKRRSVALNATVAKTSAGAIHHVPVARVTNLAATIEQLKGANVWIYGAGPTGTVDFRQADYRVGTALVIGHEGKGISRLVWEKCDVHVRLPMAGQVASLNAAVAAALLMYEVYRQRVPFK